MRSPILGHVASAYPNIPPLPCLIPRPGSRWGHAGLVSTPAQAGASSVSALNKVTSPRARKLQNASGGGDPRGPGKVQAPPRPGSWRQHCWGYRDQAGAVLGMETGQARGQQDPAPPPPPACLPLLPAQDVARSPLRVTSQRQAVTPAPEAHEGGPAPHSVPRGMLSGFWSPRHPGWPAALRALAL